ncbi:MAG: NAD(P)H-binding protein [Alphaproteobacteria bacterium]|nr:NAD(P)H-binding protein [Alphaproteobacteria bacterium]
MPRRIFTVFGGTGFLGRRIVAGLLGHGFAVRVASRHPDKIRMSSGTEDGPTPVRADVRDADAVDAAVSGAEGVANAVSLYHEGGGVTFRGVHVDGARNVAEACRRHAVRRLAHISGIGSDPASSSSYVRHRGLGEAAVRDGFADAVLLRPSVMFGPDDALLTTLAALGRWMPVIPLFGQGTTRLQPVFVDDVAQAVTSALAGNDRPERLYELVGPEVCTYRELMAMVLRSTGRRRLLLPLPFFLWDGLAAAARLLPAPPVTEGQVALMKRDNVAAPALPGLRELGVAPTPIRGVLDTLSSAPGLRPSR